MHRPTFSVRYRFALVVIVAVPSLLALAGQGSDGLTATRSLSNNLFNDIIVTEHASADMVAAMDAVHVTAVSTLATRASDPVRARALTTQLSDTLIPTADADLATVVRLHAGDQPDELLTIAQLQDRWTDARSTWNAIALDRAPATASLAQIDAAFARLGTISHALVARESTDGRAAYLRTAQPFESRRRRLFFTLGLALAATLLAVVWLARGVVPRTRKYAAFADRIAQGEFEGHLDARGHDDLAVLGQTLEEMATRRQQERAYDTSQQEFAESMQFTENEAEAHRTLKRHLERSIPDSVVVVLNRNNSQNRLEAVTDVEPGSCLEATLVGAEPRSCVAVRQARTYEHAAGAEALLECAVCASCPGVATCTPFLVGGEVIGAVLVTRPDALEPEQSRRVRDAVVQAAPVMANLRNLAIAETRAATDSLTGLPNRRSVDANLMRMVAHAGRSKEPIAVLLLDLDHFKTVNDCYGHAGGDEVLAGVGAALRATLRDSDFAGRYGGEEFIVALPNTNTEGAVEVAELLRRAVGEINVPAVDRRVTVSVGIAVLPDHAPDASGVVRAADRALYLAKNNGRDRLELVRPDDLGDGPEQHRAEVSAGGD